MPALDFLSRSVSVFLVSCFLFLVSCFLFLSLVSVSVSLSLSQLLVFRKDLNSATVQK